MEEALSSTGLSDQAKGVVLAVSSSVFIGSSFIIKKKGLRRAGSSGIRAGSGGYSYLSEPLWWTGLLSMVVGEIANFAAYAFAPAILVTPLGALSILVSAVLAHRLLHERLNAFGVIGCVLCVTGSVAIVLAAPPELEVPSVLHLWNAAWRPGFVLYALAACGSSCAAACLVPRETAQSNPLVYVFICSAVGSLSVVSVQALGIAIKLTLAGDNQFGYPPTYAFAGVVIGAVLVQMNYLNRALDLFNTAIVTPLYYVMFTTLTIAAAAVMHGSRSPPAAIAAQAAGFVTIVCGTALLHATKDMDPAAAAALMAWLPRGGEGGGAGGGAGAASLEDGTQLSEFRSKPL